MAVPFFITIKELNMSELTTLFPGKEVTLSSGEVIKVEPFKFGQLPLALKLTQNLAHVLKELYTSGQLTDTTKTATNLMYLMAEGGEDFIHLVGLCIGKNRGWFDTLAGDDGINLVVAFLEVNVDFFTKKMLPQLLAAVQKLQEGK